MRIHLDFETRSEVGIAVGAWKYSIHPSTKILCMAYGVNKEPVLVLPHNEVDIMGDLFKDNIANPNCLFVAHYAGFEYYIWHNILVKKFGAPPIPPRQWRCTAVKAASYALPRSLAGVGVALGLQVTKDMEGKKVMLQMCKPRKALKHEREEDELMGGNPPVRWHETEEQFQKLYSYCGDDVEVERLVDDELPDLDDYEQEVWFEDQVINRRGIRIDIEAVDSALNLIKQYVVRSNKKIEVITGGELSKVTSPLNVLRWAKEQGVFLPDFTKETVKEVLKNGGIPEHVKQVLEIRKQLGKTSTAKYKALKEGMDVEGILREILVYWGATTGRWTGKQFQPHNLPRGNVKDIKGCIDLMKENDLEMFEFIYPEVMEAVSSCIRGMVIPREGKDFIVSDYAAIETRFLFWYANEYKGLERYTRKQDLYLDMAMRIFEKTVINAEEKYIGKQGILLCGYGGGGKRRPDGTDSKFMETCKKHGVSITDDLSERAVDTYRDTYPAVVNSWYVTERKAIEAVFTKQPIRCLKVVWSYNQQMDFLFCILPSGRKLAYYKPRILAGKLSYMRNENFAYVRRTTWGGVLVQNIMEGVCRDILVNGLMTARDQGYPNAFHVHDELVSEVDIGFGSVEEFNKIITKPPEWAQGVPIVAHGWRGDRYEKKD